MPHPRPEPSGEASPSVEGLPRQGRGEAGKGGAHALPRNVWGGARNARRVPRQIKKGLPFGSPFFIWRRGDSNPEAL